MLGTQFKGLTPPEQSYDMESRILPFWAPWNWGAPTMGEHLPNSQEVTLDRMIQGRN